jgi:hypothetical protein
MERESYVEQPAHSWERMVMAMAELKTSYMNNSEFSQYSYYGTRSLRGTPAHSHEQTVKAMAKLKTSYMNNSEFSQSLYQ